MNSIRLAFRKLTQAPFFAALAIGTLGIGIGAVATCFSAVNTLLFRPLPGAAHGERLVWVSQTRPAEDPAAKPYTVGFSFIDLTEFATRSRQLDALWGFTNLTVIAADEAGPWRVLGTRISPVAFDALGVTPQLGRNFTEADAHADATPVAIISDVVWRERFDRDPEVIHHTAELNGVATRIVGVAPPHWRYPESTDLWLPLGPVAPGMGSDMFGQRGYFALEAHAVLAPGASVDHAREELEFIAAELARAHPESNADVGVTLAHWRDAEVREGLYFTLLLFAAGIGIFLIACANIANLQLARGSDRGPEIAVRVALGASRGTILRQLVVENLVLGLLGALAGALIGLWGTDWVRLTLEIEHPFWLRFDPDWRVLTFTAVCGLVASVLFGLAPAWRDSRPDIAAGLKEGSRTGLDQGPFGQRLRNGIVIIEIALALVLLVGAGLMTRSFFKLTAIDPGYDRRQVLTFRVGFPIGYEESAEESRAFFETLPRRLERLPEVEHAGAISQMPNHSFTFGRAQLPPAADESAPLLLDRVTYRTATAGYFDTLRIPLVAGRDFAAARADEPFPVVIVDTAFAAATGLQPAALLGRKLRTTAKPGADADAMTATIVGVVGGVQHHLEYPETIPTLYFPHHQEGTNFMTVLVRTRGDPLNLADSIGNEVLAVHRGMPIYDVFTMEQVVLRSIWQPYFFSRLFLCAGVIAVLLACVGIYGVMTFNVTMRRHEIGLRMALGAPASEVVGDVVRKGLYLVVVGLGAGIIAAVLMANLLAGNLHGITPHDPPTFIVVPTLLAGVALAACYLSSRRATRIEPMAAMRAE